MKINSLDITILLILILLTGCYGFLFVDFSLPPIEDAAMIMRYAQHLAKGEGIVWNIGEPPLDGATDLLVVLVIGAATQLGLSPESGIRLLTALSHLAMVMAIYSINRYTNRVKPFLAGILALYFVWNPGVFYIATYFATPFFAFILLMVAYLAQNLYACLEANRPIPQTLSLLFVILGIFAGMTRPEGILFVGYMYIVLIAMCHSKSQAIQFIRHTLPLFLLLGGMYFFSRWYYFGYPLPNPFYRKGGFYPSSGFFSIYITAMFILPTLPVFLWGLWQKTMRRIIFLTAIPVGLFAASFILLSNEMNFCGRFQYPMLGVVLIAPFWGRVGERVEEAFHLFPTKTKFILGIYTILFCVCFPIHRYKSRGIYDNDGKYQAAMFLQSFADKDYTLATTEAGILPYYSQWRSLDVWGLNDSWITHHQVISQEYLHQYRPDVVMIHDALLPEHLEIYAAMMDTLTTYLRHQPYALALKVQSPYAADTSHHLYYVRTTCPDAEKLMAGLGKLKYENWRKVYAKGLE